MALTQKVQSSGSGSAASGLSTSDVTTLIKSNTPWQYIESVTASSSSEIDLVNSNIANFNALYIYFDNVNFSSMTNARLRLFLDSALKSDSGYTASTQMGNNTSNTNQGTSSYDSWIYGGQTYNWQHNLTGEMLINGNSGNIKVAQANIAAKNSGSGAIRSDFSGQYTGGGTITGFRFFNSSGSITSGQFHIYGLNKHD